MYLTYERPSVPAPNGRHSTAPTSEFTLPVDCYSRDEVAARTGVPRAVLAAFATERYTAIDVVRLAVLARLMRSGVPVARAAALIRAAESLATAGI